MGQYHRLINFDAKEWVDARILNGFVKMMEQIGWVVPASLIALISVNPGNGPADLGGSRDKAVGRWAGHRMAFIGDYAEAGDIPGLVPTPDKMYGLCRQDDQEVRSGEYTSIAPSLIGMLEEALSIRWFKDGNWQDFVEVRSLATLGADGRAHYELAGDADAMEWYRRMGLADKPHLWDRAPANLSWSAVLDSEIDQGQTRVIANLDRREYMDPIAFGLEPTTVGMMREPWSIGSALATTLFHDRHRGGGDAPHHPFQGIWRNDRLIASSEYDGEFPSTAEIKASFTDISSAAIEVAVLCKDVW